MNDSPFALGTPYTRVGASEGYLQSLAAIMATRRPPFKVIAGASYGNNRNRIVDWFLSDTTAEWLLQMDDDIRFPPTIFEQMMERRSGQSANARVLIGSVPISGSEPTNLFMHPECLSAQPAQPEARVNEPVRIKGFGGAIMLVHRTVYETLAKADGWACWYTQWQDTITLEDGTRTVRQLEPDLSFARRLVRAGLPAWGLFGLPLTHCKPIELAFDYPEEEKA
jgi:glycosyltransferase involved in cell wall biosynthesis